MANTIYTHDMAMDILEIFENMLDRFDISIPSEDPGEQKEREENGGARIYGTEYSDLHDEVESLLIATLEDKGVKLVTGEYGPREDAEDPEDEAEDDAESGSEYIVSLAVDGRLDVTVKADSFDDAREKAELLDGRYDWDTLDVVSRLRAVYAEDSEGQTKDF